MNEQWRNLDWGIREVSVRSLLEKSSSDRSLAPTFLYRRDLGTASWSERGLKALCKEGDNTCENKRRPELMEITREPLTTSRLLNILPRCMFSLRLNLMLSVVFVSWDVSHWLNYIVVLIFFFARTNTNTRVPSVSCRQPWSWALHTSGWDYFWFPQRVWSRMWHGERKWKMKFPP